MPVPPTWMVGALVSGVGFHQPMSEVLPPMRRTPWGARARNWAMRPVFSGLKNVGSVS